MNGTVEVVDTHGALPPFRTQSVLFVANLLGLFFSNEEENELLRREVRGAETYGGRLVPILDVLYRGGQNCLLLERPASEELLSYFGDDLALGLPTIEVLDHREYEAVGAALRSAGTPPDHFSAIARSARNATVVDGYVTDATLVALAERLGVPTVSSLEGSRSGNNKLLLHQALVEEGLPVFETRLAATPSEARDHVRAFGRLGYRAAVVKSQIGASGIGLLKRSTSVGDGDDVIPTLMFHEGPCLVQGWIEVGVHGVASVSSPSVQMFLEPGRVHLYDVTEQILSDDSIHQGNESPPPGLDATLRAELLRQAHVAGLWLHGRGYRGTASVDFLVTMDGGTGAVTAYVCEINARVTGATYPALLARHFIPRGAWLMRNLRLGGPLAGDAVLAALRRQGLLFRADLSEGVLPINFNTSAGGTVDKGQFLFLAAETTRCHTLLAEAEKALGFPWHFERD